jgi:DNA polymerase I-like protein with 3'-5' exonuclease and polymerase domains
VPYVDKIVEHLTSFYRANGFITGLDGTRIYAESEHMLLVYLLQNFEAVFMKVALCYTMDRVRKQGLRAKFVTMQHDEFQFIAHKDDAAKLAKVLEKAMVDAGKFVGSECPILGKAAIGDSWYDTH